VGKVVPSVNAGPVDTVKDKRFTEGSASGLVAVVSWGNQMGIKSAFRTVVRCARRIGRTGFEGMADRGRVEGGPVAAPTAAATVGFGSFEADEKIIRAGLVVDEWDGAVALLSRRR
jgi:hypothetical protein